MADSDEQHLKFVYRTAFVVALVGLHIAAMMAIGVIDDWVLGGGRNLGWLHPASSGFSLIGAHLIARAWFRNQGISRDSHEVLVIDRRTATANPDAPLEADLHYPPKLWATLAVMCAGCVVIMLLVFVFLPVKPGTEDAGYLLIAGFSAAAVFCAWIALTGGGFVGRADEQGVSGHHGNRVLVRSVDWERIETCEVTEVRNALGELSRPWFAFKRP